MVIKSIAAVVASIGFAILFNVRGKKIITAGLIGGAGSFVYFLLQDLGYSQVYAMFIGSMTLSALSEISARVHKCPVPTFLLCALIPLVPGGGMYYTMLEIVKNNLDAALTTGLNTLILAGSIVVGCLTVSSCVHMLNQLQKTKQ